MTLPQRSYSWKDQESLSKDTLITRIGDLRLELPGYGYHRGTRQLHREWQSVNRKKVVRLLRERGWIYQTGKKKWGVTTTDICRGFRIYPNLARDIELTAIHRSGSSISPISIF